MLVARDPATDGRGRCPRPSARRSRPRPSGCSNSSSVRSRSGRSSSPNRIVSTAHQTTLVHDHLPTDDFVAYHEARARGGVGLIVLEATAVHPSGLLTSHTLGGYLPEIADGLPAGREPRCSRTGRASSSSSCTAAASRSPRRRVRPRSLRRRSRARASASSRARCARREIDEIVAGLRASLPSSPPRPGSTGSRSRPRTATSIEQFLDPELNRRDDDWRDGQRFLAAVLRAVRAAAPGLCVGVRLSADSQRVRRRSPLLAEPRASTTSRSRSATRPRTSARSGSCRRRPSPRTRSPSTPATFAVAPAADRDVADRRRRVQRIA